MTGGKCTGISMVDSLPDHWPRRCARCGADLAVVTSTVSYFNRDTICIDCKQDETEAPGYKDAVATETAAVSSGNYNFPGVGLSPADRTFLTQRLAERRARAT